MEIKFGWSGKRAVRLGFLVLLGADVYYLFPDVFIYITGVIVFSLVFKCQIERADS